MPIITDYYKALLCTLQEGGLKVKEAAPYFCYIGAWGPIFTVRIRAGGGGAAFKGDVTHEFGVWTNF